MIPIGTALCKIHFRFLKYFLFKYGVGGVGMGRYLIVHSQYLKSQKWMPLVYKISGNMGSEY